MALLDSAVQAAELVAAAADMPPAAGIEALRAARAATATATGPVSVSSQVSTLTGRFVDLAIRISPQGGRSGASDVLVWVEVKHGADVHGDQLTAYLAAIRGFPAAHRVVLLLAPRAHKLTGEVPAEVPRVDWQTVAGTMDDLADDGDLSPEQAWLLREYVSCLNEEGLMDPKALTGDHVAALAGFEDADNALAGVSAHALTYVSGVWAEPREWRRRPRAQEPEFGFGFWASYDPEPESASWLDGWFDWGSGVPDDWEFANATDHGPVVFFSGVKFAARADPTSDPKHEAWVRALLAAEFEWCRFEDAHRLVRIVDADVLAAEETTVRAQGRRLGSWVVETFKLLEAHPPAPSASLMRPRSRRARGRPLP
jgi:hypothetical protein